MNEALNIRLTNATVTEQAFGASIHGNNLIERARL
jgi:hypothetical protein